MFTVTNGHGTFHADPARAQRLLDWYSRVTPGKPGPGDTIADAMRAAFCTTVHAPEFAYADVTERIALAVMLASAGHDAPGS